MGKHVQGEKDNINTISEFCAHNVTRCTYSVFNPVHTHAHTRSTTPAHYSFQIFLEPPLLLFNPTSDVLSPVYPCFVLFRSSNNEEMVTRSCMGWNCTTTHMMVDWISLTI